MSHVLGPVSPRITVQDSVFLQLRQALMIGKFDPGQTMTIAGLAETFCTSNMPIREAIRRLAAENALEIGQNGSARVPPVTLARLEDLCRARIAIEGLVTELAMPNLTDETIDLLDLKIDEQQRIGRGGNIYSLIEMNQHFHFVIYQAAQSPVLLQLTESLWLRFGPYMRMLSNHVAPLMQRGEMEPSGHHRAIVSALRSRDGAMARAEVARDIDATRQVLAALCSNLS